MAVKIITKSFLKNNEYLCHTGNKGLVKHKNIR